MFIDIISKFLTIIEFLSYDSSILNVFSNNSQNKKYLSEELKENCTKIIINLEQAKINSIGNKNKVTFIIKSELIKSYKFYIEMEPEKLKLWFITQKETFLYIDKNNSKYLDLEFITK